MDPIRKPRSVSEATGLCERYAVLDGQIAAIEEQRQADIAAVNAVADRAANDLIAQRDAIAAKLEPWWQAEGAGLLTGKAKSLELGGCILGSRKDRDKLGFVGDAKDIVKALVGLRWARPLVMTTRTLDKAEIAKAIVSKRKAELTELGFFIDEGQDQFYVKRAEQGRTRSAQ